MSQTASGAVPTKTLVCPSQTMGFVNVTACNLRLSSPWGRSGCYNSFQEESSLFSLDGAYFPGAGPQRQHLEVDLLQTEWRTWLQQAAARLAAAQVHSPLPSHSRRPMLHVAKGQSVCEQSQRSSRLGAWEITLQGTLHSAADQANSCSTIDTSFWEMKPRGFLSWPLGRF
jgi:hypothetical protein